MIYVGDVNVYRARPVGLHIIMIIVIKALA